MRSHNSARGNAICSGGHRGQSRSSGIAVARARFFGLARRIKILRTIIILAVLTPGWALAGEFTQTLSAEELHRLGLDQLTPEQLAALNARIEQYKALASSPTDSTPATASKPAATPATAAGQTTASSQPSPAAAPAQASSGNKYVPDWVEALITLKRVESAPEKTTKRLESRLVGDFSGWSGRTNFKLENGQIWQQVNSGEYRYTPPLRAPKVMIYPAAFGTFWLEVENVSERCRVKPIKLE